MIVALDIVLFVIVIVTAWLALRARDLLTAVALLSAYSLFAALLFTGMQALDVAFVEAALGAGLTGVLFIAAILATTRRSTARDGGRRRWWVLGVVGAFLGVMLFASTGLPDRGDPAAPAHQRVAPRYLEGSLAETETPNVVTAILADYRSMDTLGETLVILTAALAASLVLARRIDRPDEAADGRDDRPPRAGGDPTVRDVPRPDPEGTP